MKNKLALKKIVIGHSNSSHKYNKSVQFLENGVEVNKEQTEYIQTYS